MPGQSGAVVDVVGSVVIKYATDPAAAAEVERQGVWLESNPHPFLPHVIGVATGEYVMERLYPMPWNVVDASRTMYLVMSALETLWDSRPAERWSWDAHDATVARLATKVGWGPEMNAMREDVYNSWECGMLRGGYLHGDPTLGNVMLRAETSELVVTDPVTPRPDLPQLVESDKAKLLQSALGWEQRRHGQTFLGSRLMTKEVRSWCGCDEEWDAVRYFCAFHYMRATARAKSSEFSLHDLRAVMGRILDDRL